MKILRKIGAHVKALDDAGKGVAIIATLNVVDHDGDVSLPGSFGEQHAKMLPAHDWSHIPLGKAKIREEGEIVFADFQINMKLESGREWQKALKFDLENGPPLQEWSFGFTIKKQSFGEFGGKEVRFLEGVDVSEISPVVLGAGIGTQTIAIKSWNGPDDLAKIKTDQIEGRSIKLVDQLRLALFDVKAVVKRCDDVRAIRKENGQELSADRLADLEAIKDSMADYTEVAKGIGEDVKNDSDREKDSKEANEALASEFARVEFEKSDNLQK